MSWSPNNSERTVSSRASTCVWLSAGASSRLTTTPSRAPPNELCELGLAPQSQYQYGAHFPDALGRVVSLARGLFLAALPGPAAGELQLEGEAQEGPDYHEQAKHAEGREGLFNGDGVDDVGGDQ